MPHRSRRTRRRGASGRPNNVPWRLLRVDDRQDGDTTAVRASSSNRWVLTSSRLTKLFARPRCLIAVRRRGRTLKNLRQRQGALPRAERPRRGGLTRRS